MCIVNTRAFHYGMHQGTRVNMGLNLLTGETIWMYPLPSDGRAALAQSMMAEVMEPLIGTPATPGTPSGGDGY